ncbi:hypothetical protein PUNSTDRAFT_138743 [Punctularia strigosozonata HHB-11173 SS5]|uniref:Uncharacterized protein n=1 Tax=Punctularia strigosozonata (strain HHB-11173) TaxID=741275 RepID=R7S1S4_PUNST|nr:uncharacterized protein PUNSTDRAFT_138743 [Punctularia strigosozonata HHB-11173 SS5]EIN04345.1 hypothetical protein PUNSTDRAFT_138743 [Punctularia strigosozonata HHB-11173 SS5]
MTIGNGIANDVVNNDIYDGSYQLVNNTDIVSEWLHSQHGSGGAAGVGGPSTLRDCAPTTVCRGGGRSATPTSPDTMEAKFKRLQFDVHRAVVKRSMEDKRDSISYALVCPSSSGVTSVDCGDVGCSCTTPGGHFGGCDTGYRLVPANATARPSRAL